MGEGRDRKGGVIINLSTAVRNTQREWTVGLVLVVYLVPHDNIWGGLQFGLHVEQDFLEEAVLIF